jgi:hypothetical protein
MKPRRDAADCLIEAAPAPPASSTRLDEITLCGRLARYRLWRDLPRELGDYEEWAPATARHSLGGACVVDLLAS